MKKALVFVAKAVLAGLLVVVPIYLAVLVLLKGMKSVGQLVRPFARLLPDWFPAEQAMSLLLVLLICFLIGVAVRTRVGRVVGERMEKGFFQRIPGYALFRSLTQRLAGEDQESTWAGAVYILDRKRVHPLDVPFTEALKAVSRWGSGAKDLVAAMERGGNLSR
jgi:hypothetical protein